MDASARQIRRLSTALPSDAQLVLRAVDGESFAKEALFRRHVEQVIRLVGRLHRGDDADDIVQDTFADALAHLESLREPSAFRSWLLGIAVRRVRRAQRKRSVFRRLFAINSEGPLSMQASRACSPEQRAELALVDRTLARISADERIAWTLRRVQGEKLVVVAEIVGASLATVKRRIAAADARIEQERS